jgi:hypothetical protein
LNRTEKKIALHKQINDSTEELNEKASGFKNLSKDVMVIGGIILAGYAVMKMFQSDEDEHEIEPRSYEPQSESMFLTAVKGAATSALLAIAKVKLSEYIESLSSDNE